MKTIYKYSLTQMNIQMPTGAQILHCAMQGDTYCLWALVDTDAPTENRSFRVLGTGWEVTENMAHIGTCFEGSFVWHIMELV